MIPTHIQNAVRAKLLADFDTFAQLAVIKGKYNAKEVMQDFVRWLAMHEGLVAVSLYRDDGERPASNEEIKQSLLAYQEGVLTEYGVRNDSSPGNIKIRQFDGAKDAEQVQMALALRGLKTSASAIVEMALRMNMC